jgi:hypothetical protein
MNEIVVVKLCTGEIVIGRTYDTNPEYLENVFMVNFAPSHEGRVGIELVPYMYPFETVGCDIDIKHIIRKMPCPKELENAYIESTTGIVIKGTVKPNPLSIVK